jgi:5'-nucleotidase
MADNGMANSERSPLFRRILLVNDDGIESKGLALLAEIAGRLSEDVWIVAPDEERSGASQSISLSQPLRCRQLGERRFAVKGTPADCVLLAVEVLLAGSPPSVVLSGINHGENLADDMAYSGTGAAMEACEFGIPGIALSQVREPGQMPDFGAAVSHAEVILRRLANWEWEKGVAVNINFPPLSGEQVKGIKVTPAGRRPRRPFLPKPGIDGRNVPLHWLKVDYAFELPVDPGTDIAAVRDGSISVTALRRDPTCDRTNNKLQKLLQV